MERLAAPAAAPLAGAEGPEVLRRLWNNVSKQLENNLARGLAVERYLEEYLRIALGSLLFGRLLDRGWLLLGFGLRHLRRGRRGWHRDVLPRGLRRVLLP